MIGTRLSSWVIEKELGRGGMGQVYLARKEPASSSTPDYAAVKILAAELAVEAGFLQRFQREIDALRVLNHPHIVRFYEAGTQDGLYYYVMEYVPGRNCEELFREQGRLPWNEVLDIALQIVPALKHAHDRGIIHRDLKPNNLLRAEDGTIKLTDFGIAKVFASQQLTATGALVGTADYLSPEQAAGKPVTSRSDLYSLGVVLYAFLTGRPPFEGDSVVELLHKHRYSQFDRPRRIVPDIPHDLDDLVCQLLEKDPAKRPANAQVLERQLERIRRKLERVAQTTLVRDAADPSRGIDPSGLGSTRKEPGPATLMSRLMQEELESQSRGGPWSRFLNRPVVVVSLFVLCMGVIVWRLWPRPAPAASELFQEGSRLMASDNPQDWDRAWNEYFEPLNKKYPDHPYQTKVEQYRQQKADWDALADVIARARQAEPASEAQRFFEKGLRLCRQGEAEKARWIWQKMIETFQGIGPEECWIRLAKEGLARLDGQVVVRQRRIDSIRQVARQAQKLRQQGNKEKADAIWQGLEALYRDDPSAQETLQKARQEFAP